MALAFYASPETPAQCAVEISRDLKEHPRLQLRMESTADQLAELWM
jgi:hypothetical protein